jgi:hypothetical protein
VGKTFLKRLFFWLGNYQSKEQMPYRQAIARSNKPDGEHVKLACGHNIVVIRHQPSSYPCTQCLEDKLVLPRTADNRKRVKRNVV